MNKPTKEEIFMYLYKRMKYCKVPVNAHIPYTFEAIWDRAKLALERGTEFGEKRTHELCFIKIGDCWAPDLRRM